MSANIKSKRKEKTRVERGHTSYTVEFQVFLLLSPGHRSENSPAMDAPRPTRKKDIRTKTDEGRLNIRSSTKIVFLKEDARGLPGRPGLPPAPFPHQPTNIGRRPSSSGHLAVCQWASRSAQDEGNPLNLTDFSDAVLPNLKVPQTLQLH